VKKPSFTLRKIMSQINTALSAVDNVLALVNAANASQTLTSAQVTLSAPTIITPDADGRNTSVVISPAAVGNGFVNSATITYARRGLTDSVASPVLSETNVDDSATDASVLAYFVAQLGLVASEVALVGSVTRPTDGTAVSTVTIAANAGSLLYVDGSTQDVTLNWVADPVDLSQAISVTALSGFDAAPVPTPAPTATPTPTPAVTDTPAPTDAPAETPAPSDTPAPTDAPVETPAPSAT
jgi:hypothetical protein